MYFQYSLSHLHLSYLINFRNSISPVVFVGISNTHFPRFFLIVFIIPYFSHLPVLAAAPDKLQVSLHTPLILIPIFFFRRLLILFTISLYNNNLCNSLYAYLILTRPLTQCTICHLQFP